MGYNVPRFHVFMYALWAPFLLSMKFNGRTIKFEPVTHPVSAVSAGSP